MLLTCSLKKSPLNKNEEDLHSWLVCIYTQAVVYIGKTFEKVYMKLLAVLELKL